MKERKEKKKEGMYGKKGRTEGRKDIKKNKKGKRKDMVKGKVKDRKTRGKK